MPGMRQRNIRICRSTFSPAIIRLRRELEENAVIDLDGITDRMLWLIDRVTEDGWFAARVLPQLHVTLWETGAASSCRAGRA